MAVIEHPKSLRVMLRHRDGQTWAAILDHVNVAAERDGEVVEYVPADQLRGAVEVRDAARDLLRVLDRFDNAPVSAVNATDRLRAALARLGGQS
jgi:hypothetical protein